MSGWNIVLLAGQRPGVDPLSAHFGLQWKALVPVAGRAMLARCLDNLRAVPGIATITIVGQAPDALLADPDVGRAAADPRVRTAVSGQGIATSIAALAGGEVQWPVLVTTADHPLLRSATIDAFLAQAQDCDIAVGMVERKVVQAAFPDNRRTWLHFRGGSWTGANLIALNGPAALDAGDLGRNRTASQKGLAADRAFRPAAAAARIDTHDHAGKGAGAGRAQAGRAGKAGCA